MSDVPFLPDFELPGRDEETTIPPWANTRDDD